MILITLGDPYSVNIECLSKILPQESGSQSLVLIGCRKIWDYQASEFAFIEPLPIRDIKSFDDAGPGINFLDIDEGYTSTANPKKLSDLERGRLAFLALEKLKSIPLVGHAILTSPINKNLAMQAGFQHPGQTEYFAALASEQGIMILAGPRLRVGLVTNHLALSDVATQITESLVYNKLKLFSHSLMKTFGIKKPKIGVTGLNPHCGDGGMFGDEDTRIIGPSLERFKRDFKDDVLVEGPIPADTSFFRAYEGELDAILCMYHDQGLGPLKTVHFYDAVNITGGLPFLRLSPDHGPAADKYGLGVADTRSFAHALQYCYRYLGER